jgi:hypothetical protein
MARRKQPETAAEWKQEISLQLLALVRTRTISNINRRYDAVRDLAELHGVVITGDRRATAAADEPTPTPAPTPAPAPVEVAPERQPTGGSILDEMENN